MSFSDLSRWNVIRLMYPAIFSVLIIWNVLKNALTGTLWERQNFIFLIFSYFLAIAVALHMLRLFSRNRRDTFRPLRGLHFPQSMENFSNASRIVCQWILNCETSRISIHIHYTSGYCCTLKIIEWKLYAFFALHKCTAISHCTERFIWKWFHSYFIWMVNIVCCQALRVSFLCLASDNTFNTCKPTTWVVFKLFQFPAKRNRSLYWLALTLLKMHKIRSILYLCSFRNTQTVFCLFACFWSVAGGFCHCHSISHHSPHPFPFSPHLSRPLCMQQARKSKLHRNSMTSSESLFHPILPSVPHIVLWWKFAFANLIKIVFMALGP